MKLPYILLVEDDFTVSLDIREAIEESGFLVEAVYCARAAFEALASGPAPLALVSDIDLGRGPDGFDVARRARANYPDLPVVFISGTRSACHASQGVEGSKFLDKPVRPQRVIEALRGVIGIEVERRICESDPRDPASRQDWRDRDGSPAEACGTTVTAHRPRKPVNGGLASQAWAPMRLVQAPFITARRHVG